jgi:hypothetical protein
LLLALHESKPQMLDMEDRLIKQVRNVRVVEGVDDAPPLPLADHEPEVAKHTQLVRDRRAFHLNRDGEFVHGACAFAEPRENANPARRCKRLHRFRNLPRGRRIDDGLPVVSLDAMTHPSEDT